MKTNRTGLRIFLVLAYWTISPLAAIHRWFKLLIKTNYYLRLARGGDPKLFADGSVYSQRMQMREPYLDDHHGEWIMPPRVYAKAFRIYWDAGYQSSYSRQWRCRRRHGHR